jgi:selenocysteine lyase/cysteine desulfurase
MSAVPSFAEASQRPSELEGWFRPFRERIVGIDATIDGPFGARPLVYADWIASGRLYAPIEERIRHEILPYIGNTHTETSYTGAVITRAYHDALARIKRHVHAGPNDAIVSFGSGMTAVVNKFQRMLGLRVHENYRDRVMPRPEERPVVFVTHMEHHSNQTSWIETLAEVRVIPPTAEGLVDLAALDALLDEYRARPVKIASVTSCSNVTGIITPYHEIARRMHAAGGLCFVDFAASAPYIDIDMHPAGIPGGDLDAIFFSPHKFLGGPGTSGILVFDKRLYRNRVPDNPGGGTVDWTNPWGEHKYVDDVEAREDGGTPGFLQAIRTALAIALKEQMGVDRILAREHALIDRIWPRLAAIPGLHVLADQHRDRIGCISFYVDGLHYNLAVQLLNDRYGVQVRGGCSCAGTYGHYLLAVSRERSRRITDAINAGCLADKPGWVRLSLHPTMTDAEVDAIADAIEAVARHHREWARDYRYCERTNAFRWAGHPVGDPIAKRADAWFRPLE